MKLTAIAGVISMAGCAGLQFKEEALSFPVPAAILGITAVEPNSDELAGISLRFLYQSPSEIQAEENLKMYSQLHDGQGLSLELHQRIIAQITPINEKKSFLQKTTTTFEGQAGQLTETAEFSQRGEILRFIEGSHDSKAGKFKIVSESRSPTLPKTAVRIGDHWRYNEKTEASLESLWIKEKNPTPYVLEAQSELTGFAVVQGHRCAVIKTTSVQTKSETVVVLFKKITAEIRAEITETQYFDYRQGVLIARVTVTSSRSFLPELGKEDHGVSQAIYRIIENTK